METTNYIEFKKERDLGAIISDTFKFIRHNWKTYFLTLIKISYPALLFFLASLILYLYFIGDIYSGIGNIEDNSEYFGSNLIVLIIAVIFMLISLVVLYALIQGSTLNYMKSYVNNFGV
ncbi:MAG: hypothetical protein KDC69_03325, partial [Flavobacteriaceae bacterium]|nr:hypothetical protein [Flavobacteriaceae bacterium]